MPSTRQQRSRVLAFIFVVSVALVWWFSHDTYTNQIYSSTVSAMDRKAATHKDPSRVQGSPPKTPLETSFQDSQGDDVLLVSPDRAQDLMKQALVKSKVQDGPPSDNTSNPPFPKQDLPGDKSVAGRKTMKGGELKDLHSGKESPMGDGVKDKPSRYGPDKLAPEPKDREEEGKSAKEMDATAELNSILKIKPIIIFSKTFCPHSKDAKRILLDKYIITPEPHVVELDQHPHGKELQALLAEKTKRRTVPNVMANGISIGGGDDILEFDRKGDLEAKLSEPMKGTRVIDVKLRHGR